MSFTDSEMGLVYYNPFSPNSHDYPANMLELGYVQSGIYSEEDYSLSSLMMSMIPASQTCFSALPSSEIFTEMPQATKDRNLDPCSPLPSVQSKSPFCQVPLPPPFLRGSWEQPHNQPVPGHLKAKQDRDSGASQHHLAFYSTQNQQQGMPNTMSPKDILFKSNQPEEPDLVQFTCQENDEAGMDQLNRTADPYLQTSTLAYLQRSFNAGSMPFCLQLPYHSPRGLLQEQTISDPSFPLVSSAGSGGFNPVLSTQKGPTNSTTKKGICLPQKHKRGLGRRAAAPSNAQSAPVASPNRPNALKGRQSGPHRCDRISPSTGKPCNTVFSRPYDLTRHEDSIHNRHKRKPRCNLCTEEKTFSRADALTRHYRVCHPDLQLTIKRRRREACASDPVGNAKGGERDALG
ncbi:hypothetical protein PG994_015252 [Apiospora phragmitis]|uniref:C2H2-type domain-containing protein n=1 Tax=Apiospora phragmitis TaxID=2905665 RepID=A0ABR1SSP7_9PEZI